MPGFTLDASVYVFDAARAEAVIRHFQETEMRRAIQAFLTACLARIPVRTGFLKGSFGNINRFFGNGPITDLNARIVALFRNHPGTTAPVGRARELSLKQTRARASRGTGVGRGNHREANPQLPEYYYDGKNKILKTPYSGLPYATPQEQVLTRRGDVLTFNFDVSITYYRINDFYARIRGAPWNSLQAGQEALLASLDGAATRFPVLGEIAGTARVRVEGTNHGTTVTPPPQSFLLSPLG